MLGEMGLGFFFFNLYMWGYFSIFNIYINGSGLVRVRVKFLQKPRPASGFFFFFFLKKTHTRPYNLSRRVKPDPLGLGWATYPWAGYKLPSQGKSFPNIRISKYKVVKHESLIYERRNLRKFFHVLYCHTCSCNCISILS